MKVQQKGPQIPDLFGIATPSVPLKRSYFALFNSKNVMAGILWFGVADSTC
jgi:hypothetical protein